MPVSQIADVEGAHLIKLLHELESIFERQDISWTKITLESAHRRLASVAGRAAYLAKQLPSEE